MSRLNVLVPTIVALLGLLSPWLVLSQSQSYNHNQRGYGEFSSKIKDKFNLTIEKATYEKHMIYSKQNQLEGVSFPYEFVNFKPEDDLEWCLIESCIYFASWNSLLLPRNKVTANEKAHMWVSFEKDTDSTTKLVFHHQNRSYPSVMNQFSVPKRKADKDLFKELLAQTSNRLWSLPGSAMLVLFDVKVVKSNEFIDGFMQHYNRCWRSLYTLQHSPSVTVRAPFTKRSVQNDSESVNADRSKPELSAWMEDGDILVRRNIRLPPNVANRSRVQFSSVPVPSFQWPSAIVPYEVHSPPHSPLHHSPSTQCVLQQSLLQLMLNTCVRFRRRRSTDERFLNITIEPDYPVCYSEVGMNPDDPATQMVLTPGCLSAGSVVHELMHALGFHHMHKRHDRHRYVRVTGLSEHSFGSSEHEIGDYQTAPNEPHEELVIGPWDFESVMLYGAAEFANFASGPTQPAVRIEPLDPSVVMRPVNQKPGISRQDSSAVRKLYKCAHGEESYINYLDSDLIAAMRQLVAYGCHLQPTRRNSVYRYFTF